jgi:D-alanyl-D-alanine carboxypeptidase (penicillin-binding protein 5/6)
MTCRRRLAAAAAAVAAAAVLAPAGPVSAASAPIGGPLLGFTGTVVGSSAGVAALPTVVAGGWLVADLDTGQVLAAHDPHGRYAPASCLKLLTALAVVPELAPTRLVRATSAEAATGGTLVGMVPGHSYPVSELLQGMLMVSGNDAATALAAAAGGLAPTIAAMNAAAQALHADDTDARTVDGLDAPGQTSSAYDIALIARAALLLPAVRADVATPTASFTSPGTPTFQIQNHNPLLGTVPGVFGVKNGYTVAAQASYVGVARRGDHTVMVVLLRTRPDFTAEATALLDWGFAADGKTSPIGSLVDPGAPTAAAAAPRATAATAAVTTIASGHHGRGAMSDLEYLLAGAAAALAVVVGLGERRRRSRYAHRFRQRSWR